MDLPSEIDVLIVGAGPTGLMLANQLVRRGVAVAIVDKNPGPAVETRALGVQARTLEIYAQLGIAERAVELGRPTAGVNLWVAGRRGARIPFGDIGRDLSPYPFLLILGQDDNERLLGERLREQDVHVHWSTELVGLVQASDHVTATLARADGSRHELRAAWLAGCDGPRSTVRGLCQIDFPGAAYEHVFFVADTHARGPMVPDELNVYLWRSGFHLFFPLRGPDHWRLVGIVPGELRGRDDLAFDELVPSLRAGAGPSLAFDGCSWFSTYRIHHRRAARFRERRCFLLGDAAHIHSPVGAQGMNTGLQDAYNLAWKLAYVVRGRAREGLLDSYAAEREPVAERLLRTTDRAFALIVSERRLAGLFRTRVFARLVAAAMRRERLRQLVFRTISQIGIRYAESPLSGTTSHAAGDAPRAGDRFPWLRVERAPRSAPESLFARLDDRRFNLIAVGQDAPELPAELAELVHAERVIETAANRRELTRVGIGTRASFLLRPDGHVGLAGGELGRAELTRYLVDTVGLHVAAASAAAR